MDNQKVKKDQAYFSLSKGQARKKHKAYLEIDKLEGKINTSIDRIHKLYPENDKELEEVIREQKRKNKEWLKTFINPDPLKYRFGLCDYTQIDCVENPDGRFVFIEYL